jgi:predicted aspartyl protease
MLPLTLVATRSVAVSGLLDTGATVNVLPYASGVELGFDWGRQTTSVRLGGNLAIVEARAIAVSAVVGSFAPVRLAFAWAHVDD